MRVSRWFEKSLSEVSPARLRRLRLLAALALAGVLAAGGVLDLGLSSSLRRRTERELLTALRANVEALDQWVERQESIVSVWADTEVVTDALAALRAGRPPEEVQGRLRSVLGPVVRTHGLVGFLIVDPDGIILAASEGASVGQEVAPPFKTILAEVARGRAAATRPFLSSLPVPDRDGTPRVGVPTMVVVAPVFDERRQVLAGLGFRQDPASQFTDALTVAQPPRGGDVFAFDRTGRLVSRSLREPAPYPDGRPHHSAAASVFGLEARSPGPEPRLTAMAASAIRGRSGVNLDGYPDRREVEVVGAWTWIPALDIGLAVEVDRAECFRISRWLRLALGAFVACVLATLTLSFGLSALALQLRRRARSHHVVGEYVLEELLGRGGMGEVYRGTHTVLQRPTAVKLIRMDRMDRAARQRFEREARLAAHLTHPNTVVIHDYGRTDDGIFYTVMEYIRGFTLEEVITIDGALPEARVASILSAIAGSLAEAHEIGLIHRDIKPTNVMMCRRGGLADIVKVLDFGLVRRFLPLPSSPSVTSSAVVIGTPDYMSPEAFRTPDAMGPQGDIYSVGVVAYYLLTGTLPFSGDTVFAIADAHSHDPVEPPSARIGMPVEPTLEAIILHCMEKDPAARPRDGAALLELVERCPQRGRWTQQMARAWWDEHADLLADPRPAPAATPPPPTTRLLRRREARSPRA